MKTLRRGFAIGAFHGALLFVFFLITPSAAHAAITVAAPPIDGVFTNPTIGGSAIVPLVRFKLVQSDGGTDTLSKVGFTLNASSTYSAGLSRVSLWKESGAHPGFQVNEDTPIAGAGAVTPAVDGSLIVLSPATAVSLGATSTEFFIVATTTGVTGITNGSAFDIRMQQNYASTTAGSGIGAAFNATKKITLVKSATLKISEVKAGATGNAGDEFIELYNSGEADIDLKNLPLALHTFYTSTGSNGSSSPVALTYYNTIILQHGYFLLANPVGYSGATPPDAIFATSSARILLPDGGFSLATTSGTVSTSSKIDLICWGAQPIANCEGANPQLGNLSAGNSYERKAVSGSTNATMAAGGADSTKGNSYDSDDNDADFVTQSGAGVNPQNSFSPGEFPFGGGGTDMESLRVTGSFPGQNQSNVPKDITYIGFGFNKPISSGSFVSGTATTTMTLTAPGSSTNLCSSTSYNPFPGSFSPPATCNITTALSPSTTYTFTATSSIYDLSGNALDQDSFTAGNQPYQITFTTGSASQTMTNTTPPAVVGVTPFNGAANIPTNIAKIFIKFNQLAMDSTTFGANISITGGSISGTSFDATSSTLTVTPPSLSANTQYALTIGTGVRNTTGIPLSAPYVTTFTTGAGAVVAAPTITSVIPAVGQTLTLNTVDFVFNTDQYLDPSTATSGAVTLATGGNNLPGTVTYDSAAKEGHFTANNALPANVSDLTLTFVGGALKSVSGVAIVTKALAWSTETTNSDVTAPSPLFAKADQFGVAITFNEAVKQTDATNLANYSLTVGGNTITLSSLAGHIITYDAATRTAQIKGLFLTPAAAFTVAVSGIKDVSGNLMSGSVSLGGTVLTPQQSGGFLAPGSATGSNGPQFNNFTASGIGFMPGIRVTPMNAFVLATTTYGFEMPLTKQIPASGKIVITFPQSYDFGVCCAATSSTNNPFVSQQNLDINGPGTGTIGFNTVVNDNQAKTVTLTLSAATRSESSDTHDFLRFAVVGIKNPSSPKDVNSQGYAIDIKTKDASGGVLESFTSSPIYISGGGGSATTTIQGTVSGNGGNLNGVTVRLMSPMGMVESTSNSSGLFQFTNVAVNNQISTFGTTGMQYMLSTDPVINPTGTTTAFFGEPMPTPVYATSTSIVTRNFSLTATTSAISFNVNLTGDNSSNAIFPAGQQLDVFAGGPNRFIVQTITTSATNYSATTIANMPLPQVNGNWSIGVGPAMPRSMGSMSFGPPPQPAWLVPKPVSVTVSGCPSACTATINNSTATSYTFTVSATNRSIIGILKDGSGNAISSADVFAYAPSAGLGNHAQSSASGAFTVNVTDGSYNVGAFVPGIGNSTPIPVVVKSTGVFVNGATSASTGSSGANPFVLTLKKSNTTITGKVTDGTNPVSGAPVFAYRTDGPGRADAVTDSSGNYTLYADVGTWQVNAVITGFGPAGETTVTVSSSGSNTANFSPSTATSFKTISGTVFESSDSTIDSTEGISGVVVRVSGTNGSNQALTGSDGTYSIRVPSGSYTFADIYKPGYGKIAALDASLAAITTITATSDVTKNVRVNTRSTITITIKDSSGAALTVGRAFIDLFDLAKNLGNRVEITNATSTTLQVAQGASTTIRAYIEGVPSANVSAASDDADSLVLSGILRVDSTTEKIKITVNTNTAALSTVSGTVYAGSATAGNELADAWVDFVDPTNNTHVGTQASSTGVYLIKLANGSYNVQAMKAGYIGTPAVLTVSGATSTANVLVTAAASTISGTITAGGSAASNAFVWAEKLGGGFTSTRTDTSGAYSLTVDSGQWRVFAAADGYNKAAYSANPVSVGTSNVTIALTSQSTVSTKLASSDTFADTSASTFSDSTVGVKVALDGGTLGSAGTTAYLSAKRTTNLPQTLDTTIIGSNGLDISATNGSTAVTNLSSGKTAEVTLNYSKSDLTDAGVTTTTKVGNLTVVSWSDDKKAWEQLATVATYKDSNGDPITSPSSNLSNVSSVDFTTSGATHFSPYALGAASSSTAPVTPSGFAAAASNNSAVLTWTANTENDLSGYYVYRDTSSTGSFPLAATLGAVITYTDSGRTEGTTYYYKISAYNSSSNESAATSASSVTVALSSSNSSSNAGGGGGGSIATASSATTPTPVTTTASTPVSAKTPASSVSLFAGTGIGTAPTAAPAKMISPVFTKNLVAGSRGTEVKRLQELLRQDKSIYPEGAVTGTVGPKTVAAIKRFQAKYGLPKTGTLGPRTRAKLQQVFGASANPAAASSAPASQSGASLPATQSQSASANQATTQSLQNQLRALQTQLLELQKLQSGKAKTP